MRKLKIILNSNIFIIILLFISLLNIFLLNKSIKININQKEFICTILNVSKKRYNLDCSIEAEAKIDDETLKIGDVLKINGSLESFYDNTNFNLFNYK